ncbi:MAG: ferrous iron transport protein B [Candidatus Dadabacteria bacterium]|nr:MAG: ferrous iron transport protein B [Candidatus Dadabacteria bacterium]
MSLRSNSSERLDAGVWVAIAGNPNTGKTSIFNAITGLRQKVGNYPGVTVERRTGVVTLPSGRRVRCVDLPGCYSLVARSHDEQIAHDVLVGQMDDMPEPNLVIIVADASNLERNLYLASQILDLGIPCVLALNMIDVAIDAGLEIDVDRLAREIGAPVVATVAVREEGIDRLLATVERELDRAQPQATVRRRPWRMEEEIEREVARLAEELGQHNVRPGRADAEAIWLLSSVRESDELTGINPHIRQQVLEIQERLERRGTPFRTAEIQARYAWIERVVAACVRRGTPRRTNWTARLDALFTHRIAGPAIFFTVMALVFQSIFAWADPAIGLIETAFDALADFVRAAMPPGVLRDLITQGIIAGAGNVVVFLPQILILFFAINLLEDTGYMARAAFMMDRIMSRVGLHGRAFIPLLSSFACAIPGIMATRTIENRRDRLVTILVAPLMSCSARLPVYSMVIAAVFDADRRVAGIFTVGGLVLLSMYLLSIVAAITMAFVFKNTILRGPRPPFVLEMPPYRLPRLRSVLLNMWERAALFLRRAGTVIVAATVVLWALLSYPRSPELERDFAAERARIQASLLDETARAAALAELDREEAAARVRASYGGRLGRALEPLIAPLGFDWKIGIGLIGAFSAREVLVSTLGVVYGVGETDETSAPLREKLRADRRPDGTPLFTPLVGLSLMIYFVLACQCVSTLAVVRRETNGWRWPLFMLGYMTALAWIASFAVYQGGRLLGYA